MTSDESIRSGFPVSFLTRRTWRAAGVSPLIIPGTPHQRADARRSPDSLRFGGSLAFPFLCLAWLCVGSEARAQEKPNSEPAPTSALKTNKPIKIDGVLDEAVWKQTPAVRVDYLDGQVGKLSDQPRMVVRYAWDGDYLYIGYETFDRNIVALPDGKQDGPKSNRRDGCNIYNPAKKADVVEFFISFGDRQFFWELHHNAANHFNDVWCAVLDEKAPVSKSSLFPFGLYFGNGEFLQDDVAGGRTLTMATKPKPKADGKTSTVNDASDVDSGYAAEIRIPWFGLGAPRDRRTSMKIEKDGKPVSIHGPWKMADQELMILAVFQDGDLAQRYHHSSPTYPGGWFHKNAHQWPRYSLTGTLTGKQ